MLGDWGLQGELYGMVEATIEDAVGPDVLQEIDTRVRTLPTGDETPRWVEISLAYQGRSARSITDLHDLPTPTARYDEVEDAVLPLLEQAGLLPRPVAAVQRPGPRPGSADAPALPTPPPVADRVATTSPQQSSGTVTRA